MTAIEITALTIWVIFYASFFGKMFLLKRRGIDANLLGKGEKPEKARRVERWLKAVTFTGASLQFILIFFSGKIWGWPAPEFLRISGLFLAATGAAFFIAAMFTMKTNWRSGCDISQNTALVVSGPYKISRNPAFLGFDLLYIGWMLTFPNVVTLLISSAAIVTFHLQILEEEHFLKNLFSGAYLNYSDQVNRYFGKKVYRRPVSPE